MTLTAKAPARCTVIQAAVAAKGVTVVNVGTLPNRRGSITIDDEGTPSSRNVLIEDGILVGFMQDRQNARLMGLTWKRTPPSCAAPMPRMTNTIMEGGNATPAELLSDLKDGIYAVGFGGGQVDITNGKFVFPAPKPTAFKMVRSAHRSRATLIRGWRNRIKTHPRPWKRYGIGPRHGNMRKIWAMGSRGVGQPSVLIGGLTVGRSGSAR